MVAVTPAPAALIASAMPDSVLFEASMVMVCKVPLPTWIDRVPVELEFCVLVMPSAASTCEWAR